MVVEASEGWFAATGLRFRSFRLHFVRMPDGFRYV